MDPLPEPARPTARRASLDELRGATVLAMWVVNFLGGYAAIPEALKHHDAWMSLADLVMPLFFYAAGAAARLGVRASGGRVPPGRMLRRILGLFLLGAALYAGPSIPDAIAGREAWLALGKRELFQTLVHLAATTAFTLPVIARGSRARLAWLTGAAALHTALLALFAFDWAFTPPRVVDGGPLGFLTWSVPFLAGSLAADALEDAPREGPRLARMAALGALLLAGGTALSRLSSGHDLLMQSQRAGTATYLVAASGFSLIAHALAVALVDVRGRSLAPLRTIGRNALAGYLLETPLTLLVRPLAPDRAGPAAPALIGCLALCVSAWAILRFLERRGWFLRL